MKHALSMDLGRGGPAPRISAVRDDRYSRDLVITLYNNGKPWKPGSGVTAVVRYAKPDGTGGSYDILPDGTPACMISDNTLTVALAPQVCTAVGLVRLTVSLISGEAVLSTFAVGVDVLPVSGPSLHSEDYYKLSGMVPNGGWTPGKLLGTDGDGCVVAVDAPKSAADGLPMPATAQVGHYFRVKALDATGKVTAVEAVDLDAGAAPAAEAYLFNDHELPALPEWDKAAYPYAFITYNSTSASVGLTSHALYVAEGVEYATNDSGNRGIRSRVIANYNCTKGGGWVESTSTGESLPYYQNLIWANFDVTHEDGTVFLAASEPVPVYSEESGTIGFETLTLTTQLDINDGTVPLTDAEAALLDGAAVKGKPIFIEATINYIDVPLRVKALAAYVGGSNDDLTIHTFSFMAMNVNFVAGNFSGTWEMTMIN